MNKMNILVIGSDKTTTHSLAGKAAHSEWSITAAYSDEQAIELFHRQDFDAVVLTESLDEAGAKKLHKIVAHQFPACAILRYTGDNNTSLPAVIQEAIDDKKRSRQKAYSFNDDVFKGFHAY